MTYISLLRPSSAFRARFTRPHSATRPNAARTTCSSPQNGTGKHCSCTGGRVPPATVLGDLRLQPYEASAAPAPDVQEQPQHHLSSSTQPRRAATGFTLYCARVAVPEYSIGAGGLMDGRMRRACSPCEAWGAWQRSRFEQLFERYCSQTNAIAENHLLRLASG
eukprot:scaffold20786_cov68-Phaeocystis_antarctica.AAC.1